MDKQINKDEGYIKNLLLKVFKGEGVFQQFEFSSWGMKHRPDFVILYPNRFVYFEIKSEFDSLARLENQITESRGLFTDVFLVAPRKHIDKAIETVKNFKAYCGAYALEDLEAGNYKPLFEQSFRSHVSINAVRKILWSEELYNFVRDLDIIIQGEKWQKWKLKANKEKLFELLYTNDDSIRLLNQILVNRVWSNRGSQGNLI